MLPRCKQGVPKMQSRKVELRLLEFDMKGESKVLTVTVRIPDFEFCGPRKMPRQYAVQRTAAAVKAREIAICSRRNIFGILGIH